MKSSTSRITRLIVAGLCGGLALGTTTACFADDATKLGTKLTMWGAEVAGNTEGTIPPYTGGLTTPPPDFKPGSGIYPDPFKDEKPIFSITAKNMAQYADKLSEGQKALLKRHPEYRMDIYPTHRSFAMPRAVAEATAKNATRATTTADSIGLKGAEGGLPFPLPKNGHEVMWNRLLNYQTEVLEYRSGSFYVDNWGRRVLTALSDTRFEYPYYQPANPDRGDAYAKLNASQSEPPAMAGQVFRIVDPLDFSAGDRRAWQYVPGQRRVKVAPELAYDTPYPGGPGLTTMDDVFLFSGRMDKFSFKLVGKREMFIPYNMYRLMLSQQTNDSDTAMKVLGTPKFPNPDLMRWELHRVWVVESELLPGKRHSYKRRVFYWDEDGYSAGMVDTYDRVDKLLIFGVVLPIQLYDRDAMLSTAFLHQNLFAGVYLPGNIPTASPIRAGLKGQGAATVWSKRDWAPESMGAGGAR